MKKLSKVRAFRDGKYESGIVTDIQDAKGFKHQYIYQRVWVEFLDEKVIEYRSFDIIEVAEEPAATKKGK